MPGHTFLEPEALGIVRPIVLWVDSSFRGFSSPCLMLFVREYSCGDNQEWHTFDKQQSLYFFEILCSETDDTAWLCKCDTKKNHGILSTLL